MFEPEPTYQAPLVVKTANQFAIPEQMYLKSGKNVSVQCDVAKGVGRIIDGSPGGFEFLLDTGAYISIFPYATWQHGKDQIHWLYETPGAEHPPSYEIPGFTGGGVTAQIGLVTVEFGGSKPRLEREIIAAFEMTPTKRQLVLLGLGGQVHTDGGGCVHYEDRKGWLLRY